MDSKDVIHVHIFGDSPAGFHIIDIKPTPGGVVEEMELRVCRSRSR